MRTTSSEHFAWSPIRWRCERPRSSEHLVQLLQTRHATLMAQRPEAEPGRFKQAANRAGDTHFVAPDCVRGTLRQAMALYADLGAGRREPSS
jgi:hypothetical protein